MTVTEGPRTWTQTAEGTPRGRSPQRVSIDKSKAIIWSALSVVALMAALVAMTAVVPVVISIYTAVL